MSLRDDSLIKLASASGTGTGANSTTFQGTAASGAAAVGNPVLNGSLAKTANPTAVADGQAVRNMADKLGRSVVSLISPRELLASQTTTITSSAVETTIITAAAAVFNDLTILLVTNTSAVATQIDFRSTTGGAIVFSLYLPANSSQLLDLTPYFKQAVVNTNWTAQCSSATSTVVIYATYVTNL